MVPSAQPVHDDPLDPWMTDCLRAAIAAPSLHNTQPWLFRPSGDTIDVLVDRRRQLHTQDPDGREMFVSVGAAVFNLRIALRAHGRQARVSLMPDPAEPDLAARVEAAPATEASATAQALAEAIPRRHTNRRPFADRPLPYGAVEELAGAAAVEGADLLVADTMLRDGVLSLTRTAERRLGDKPRYRAELASWTTPPGIDRRDGVPRVAFGPRDPSAALPLRDLTLGHRAPTSVVAFEPNPTIVLLFTPADAPSDWLRAGSALQRLWLTATLRGLSATPLTQLTEIPALRQLLADPLTGQVVQTVLRVGYASTPVPPTPRRPLAEVLDLTRAHGRR
jgi:hypothetical protein